MSTKKIRGLKRKWKKNIDLMWGLAMDDSQNEIFFPMTFNNWSNRKIKSKYRQELLDNFYKATLYRDKKMCEEELLTAWFDLNYIEESRVFIFKNKQEFDDFYLQKVFNPVISSETEYFTLRPLSNLILLNKTTLNFSQIDLDNSLMVMSYTNIPYKEDPFYEESPLLLTGNRNELLKLLKG